MTPAQVHDALLRILADIAPEADLQRLKPEISFRDQVDIDSINYLDFVIALHRELGVGIPETNYPQYSTLQGCIEQLSTPG